MGASWVDAQTLDVSIDFGFVPEGAAENETSWTRMVTGAADRLTLDQISGQVLLEGRDYAARLIDLPLQDGFLNKTSSEVASIVAAQGNLAADADPTEGLVGQYYQIQHSKSSFLGFSRHGNAWDLLAELADLEGYQLWVDGNTLHFKSTTFDTDPYFEIAYVAQGGPEAFPSMTISDLSMERSFGLAGPVQVKVASWNSRQRQQIVSIYPPNTNDGAAQFLVLKPNLLPDDAEKLARLSYYRISAHERVLTGRMAGELELTTRRKLRLSGTTTGWDGIYTVDRIEREMSMEAGFTQHITARILPEGESF